MMEWQPIETAPKTNRHILMFGDGPAINQCAYVGSWNHHNNEWELISGYSIVYPTHWMPLPEPPNANKENK